MIYVLILLGIFWVYMLYALIQSKTMRVRLKEDGTIWEIEEINDAEETVFVRRTDEYLAYYQNKFSRGTDTPVSVNNEYKFEEIEFIQ